MKGKIMCRSAGLGREKCLLPLGCGSSRTTPLYHLISRRWVPLVVCCDGGAGIGTFPLA